MTSLQVPTWEFPLITFLCILFTLLAYGTGYHDGMSKVYREDTSCLYDRFNADPIGKFSGDFCCKNNHCFYKP